MGENSIKSERRAQYFSNNHTRTDNPGRPHHGALSNDIISDNELSMLEPALLTPDQRKRLLGKRLKELEDNDKLIMELQLKELSTGHTSRYSDRSRTYAINDNRDIYPIGARGRENVYDLPFAYEKTRNKKEHSASSKHDRDSDKEVKYKEIHSHKDGYGASKHGRDPENKVKYKAKHSHEDIYGTSKHRRDVDNRAEVTYISSPEVHNGVRDTRNYNRARVAEYLGIDRPEVNSRSNISSVVSTTIPEDEVLDDSPFRNDPTLNRFANPRRRDTSRHNRASILDKAEKLLHERKQKENVGRNEGGVSGQTRPRRDIKRGITYVAKRSRSPSDDEEFTEVPEEVDTDAVSTYSLPQSVKVSRRSYLPSATQSEIPILYDDEEEDGYPEPRPLTDTERNRYPNYRRYEQENEYGRVNYRDPAHKKIGRSTGALVRFFRNGDPDHKGCPVTVNRSFRNLETLLVELNSKIPTTTGVKYIFKWPECFEIKSVTEFQNRCVYVVSSTKTIRKDINYGESRESFWSNKKPSAGRLRRNELGLYQKPPSPKELIRNAPLIVTLVKNLNRDIFEKVILNPNIEQSFEEWLSERDNHLMTVKAIYSDTYPHPQVKSFNHLFREVRQNNTIIACGDELLPLELTKKRQAPSSNSSNESVGEPRSRKKKPQKQQQDMGQIYENGGRTASPTSTAMSRYDTGTRYVPGFGRQQRPSDSRRMYKETVHFEIGGTIREFFPPSYMDGDDDGAKPDKMLKCEWVYGFRGRDARHNLLVLPETGELVYYVASIVVIYDKEGDRQRFYDKHNEEITVMTLHPNQHVIATGQLHGKESDHGSHIRVWNALNLSTIAIVGLGVFANGILSIGFSQDGVGRFMVALDGSEKHVLSVWEWKGMHIVARTTTSTDPVHCAAFYPDGTNNSILVTYGARHIYFWKIFYDVANKAKAKILRDRNSGSFQVNKKDDVPKSINCIAFLYNDDVVTGDTSGNLMVWKKDQIDAFTCCSVIQAHDMPISCLCLMEDGTLLSGAGNEVRAWDTNANFRLVKTRQIPQEAGSVRSIVTQTMGGNDGRLFIGTTNSAILDGSLQLKFRYLVQGHSDGLCAMSPHPFEPTFVSAGLDRVVYKWSLITHKVIWRAQTEAPCESVAMDNRHEVIAIGTTDGTCITLNAYNGMHIGSMQVGTEPILSISYSPDGMLLAMGCDDGLINVFEVFDRGQTFRKFNMTLRGHNSGVSHLDWSVDGRTLQSVSRDQELLFWDIDSMQQIKIPRMMRDVDWFTNTCNVSYNLIGPWSNLDKDELIQVVYRSNYRDLVITGDNQGRVRLYKFPCSREKAEFRNVRVYSSSVTAVALTPDTRLALTCGGNDAAMIQWELTDEP